MITEVMTLLIAVGAVMIFVVWNQGKKRQQKVEERREVEETTGKLKQELEKTANEVISRMENQVSGLEDLLDDSEKNRTILEGRVAELKKLLKRSEGQSTEIRDLLTKLEEASDTVEELQRKLEAAEKRITMTMQSPMQMQSTMMPMSSLSSMPTTQPLMTPSMMSSMINPPMMTSPLPNVPSPISPPPILSSRQNVATSTPVAPAVPKSTTEEPTEASEPVKTKATVPETPKPKKMDKAEMKAALEKVSSESSKAEPRDFAKVLEKSMEKSENEVKAEVRVPAVPDRRSIIVSSRSSQRAAAVVNSTEPVKIETRRTVSSTSTTDRTVSARDTNKPPAPINNTAKIKDMLLEGMSVEDIARETGLGRGAIELVQEMTRRKLERK
ncbi:MAG: hypothetical protein IJ862_04520 [Selenomonadaceae bacterium]|nr:hypothetical protein [Selenomonadaceae bacterium]